MKHPSQRIYSNLIWEYFYWFSVLSATPSFTGSSFTEIVSVGVVADSAVSETSSAADSAAYETSSVADSTAFSVF